MQSTSNTRWSARVDSFRPLVQHLNKLTVTLNFLGDLNLTPDSRAVLQIVLYYLKSFECILLGSIWLNVLVAIDNRNRVLHARNTTTDIEVKNLEDLLEDLSNLRAIWDVILSEAKTVATVMDIIPSL